MITKLFYIVAEHKRALLLIVCWGFLLNLVGAIANPLVLKYLFDEGIIAGDFSFFLTMAVTALILFTLLRFGNLAQSLYAQRYKNQLLAALTQRLLASYYRLPYGEVLRQGEGYFVARIWDEAQKATQPMTDSALRIVNASAMALGGLAVILYLSWQLTLLLAVVTPGLLYASKAFGAKIQTLSQEEQEEEARLRGVITGLVRAYKTVRVFGLNALTSALSVSQSDRYLKAVYTRFRNSNFYTTLGNVFLSWMETAVIIGGGYAILVGAMTFGGFMAFMNAYWLAVNGLRSLVDTVPELSKLMASIERLQAFEEQAATRATAATSRGGDGVKLQKVEFSYGHAPVLKGIDLHLRQGEKVLVEGPNGSGKSTLGCIISGLLTPTSGDAIVPQTVSAVVEPVYFPPSSLREIIATAFPDKAAEAASLAAEFSLTDVMDRCYEMLSLGQKKKFSVLMALLKEADCYVFDEPLANIDDESQERLLEVIFHKTRGKILVAIMHGAERVHDRFDRVVRLKTEILEPMNLVQPSVPEG